MWELEAWESAMVWDWDVDDLNGEVDDGKLWVPVMAQTLNTGVAKQLRAFTPVGPVMLPRQMTFYTVQLNQDRSAEQVGTLVLMPMLTP